MAMTSDDLIALLPMLLTGVAAVAVMIAIAIRRDHRAALALTVVGLLAAIDTIPLAARMGVRRVTPLLVIDGYALFLIGLFLLAALAVAFLSYDALRRRTGRQCEEFYILLLTATLGAEVMVASSHFASLVVGLEMLGISIVAMVAYPVTSAHSVEAGIKYLILSGASSAFLLLGVSLIYAQQGTMSFADIRMRLAFSGESGVAIAGIALVIVGVGFKLSLVPFHMWAPDVYQGAPAPVTGFVSTVSKGAVLGFLLRYVHGVTSEPLVIALGVLAAASMLAGNLLALMQQNIKRMLAYSSIAHLGYMLVAVIAGGALAASAVAYYLFGYFVMTLGAFAVISIWSAAGAGDGSSEREHFADYRGLFWRRPWLSAAFALALLALAGIPLTVGFIAKFFAIAAGVGGARWALVIILVVGSAIGLYYYLRLVVTLFATDLAAESPAGAANPAGGGMARGVLVVLTAALIGFGIFPGPVLAVIRAATLSLL
jgi:NADH-quinone oxidoreductase subunit N